MPTDHPYRLERNPYQARCTHTQDETQPCNIEGGTWLVTNTQRNQSKPMCSNHMARFLHARGLAWWQLTSGPPPALSKLPG